MAAAYLLDEQTGIDFVLPGCNVDQMKTAIKTHPGPVEPEQIYFDQAPEKVFAQCIRAAQESDALIVTSLLLRLIALRWQGREPGAQISELPGALGIPDLLRPPASMEPEIADFVLAFNGFSTQLLDLPKATPDQLPPEARELLRKACNNRVTMQTLRAGIQQMVELKRLHDALHSLQVMTEMLQGEGHQPHSLLDLMVRQTSDAISGPMEALGPEGQDCLERCRKVLDQARSLLQQPGENGDRLAMQCLRVLFRKEMQRLDRLIFAAVSDWPMRMLVLLMAEGEEIDFKYEPRIAATLHNSLLRRILAHSVWQDVDFRLYAMEEIIRRGQARWFVELVPYAQSVHFMLRNLEGGRQADASLTVDLIAALERYVAQGGQEGAAEIHEAIARLSPLVRRRFHEVDRNLKADFDRFGLLGDRLDEVVDWLPIAI